MRASKAGPCRALQAVPRNRLPGLQLRGTHHDLLLKDPFGSMEGGFYVDVSCCCPGVAPDVTNSGSGSGDKANK